MKVCKHCGDEIMTVDRENVCADCERNKSKQKRKDARVRRKERDNAMRSLGLTKVKGAFGGTYWE